MIIFWDSTPGGRKIFDNIANLYFESSGYYPQKLYQISEFVTLLGYHCTSKLTYIQNKNHQLIESYGLEMEDEDATAFKLKFGL